MWMQLITAFANLYIFMSFYIKNRLYFGLGIGKGGLPRPKVFLKKKKRKKIKLSLIFLVLSLLLVLLFSIWPPEISNVGSTPKYRLIQLALVSRG